MMLINTAMEHISVGTAGLVGLLGYAVVFMGLIFLMVVIIITGKIMVATQKKQAAPAPAAKKTEAKAAPGSAGKLKLYGTPERDAAMAMAIVANKLGKPLNELRFKSIKEVKQDEV